MITYDISQLKPHPKNARLHSERQLNLLEKSISQFGFLSPVLIDDDQMILAGHGRVQAAKRLGMEQVPCVVVSHLTAEEKRGYLIADNQLALLADWDDDLLCKEVQELQLDIETLGFDERDFQELVNESNPVEQQGITEEPIAEQYAVLADCKNENDQRDLFERLRLEGYECRVFLH